MAQLADYQNILYVWILIVYPGTSFCLVAVALAFHEWLKLKLPVMMQIATVLGLILAGLIIGSGNLMLYGFLGVVLLRNPSAVTETPNAFVSNV